MILDVAGGGHPGGPNAPVPSPSSASKKTSSPSPTSLPPPPPPARVRPRPLPHTPRGPPPPPPPSPSPSSLSSDNSTYDSNCRTGNNPAADPALGATAIPTAAAAAAAAVTPAVCVCGGALSADCEAAGDAGTCCCAAAAAGDGWWLAGAEAGCACVASGLTVPAWYNCRRKKRGGACEMPNASHTRILPAQLSQVSD